MEKESLKSGESKISTKSFGNALKGATGTIFEVNGLKFTVLDEWVGKNRKVQC